MDVFKVISQRHSYRGPMKDTPVPREDLCEIVQAGLDAPSGCNQQTTDFVIVDDPGIVSEIQSLHPTNEAMRQAKAYICCIVATDPVPVYEGMSFVVEDCAAATENMLLAATALGYASVWIDGWLRRDGHAETIGRLVGVPSDRTVRIVLPIGVPAQEIKPPAKKPFTERAWFNRYRGQPQEENG